MNPFQRRALRYVALAAVLGGAAYAALYFPYPPGSFPVRLLSWYLHQVAWASAGGVWLFDRSVTVHEDVVQGRFSLKIVLDCAALDAHALYGAAVLAYPAPWRTRLGGFVAGTALLAAVNVVRIAVLYVVGLRWPPAFHVLHEEVLQFGIVLTAFLAFVAWILRVQRAAARP
jgi:exosortase/archaeosortase family protein